MKHYMNTFTLLILNLCAKPTPNDMYKEDSPILEQKYMEFQTNASPDFENPSFDGSGYLRSPEESKSPESPKVTPNIKKDINLATQRVKKTPFDIFELYEDPSTWKTLISTYSTLEQLQTSIEKILLPYEELQETEDSKRALSSEVMVAIKDIVNAINRTLSGLILNNEEIVTKDSVKISKRIETAIKISDYETENIKKVMQPGTIKEAVVIRLNDMYLIANNERDMKISVEKLKKGLRRMEEGAKIQIGRYTRSIPRYLNAEEIRQEIVKKMRNIWLLPTRYKRVISDKIKGVLKLTS
eukprot:GHVP01048640.1.p1 GENE.GHVP01048640.1~~GHVP01048640.1.p1  ORF type:complete len:299 (-),score=53.53 GHVP01048640.1:862-1758(-)